MLDSLPESYWRLGEAQGTAAGSEVAVNLGKDAGTYVNAALGTAGALAGATGTAASFNGTSTRLDLPKGLLKKSRDGAVELWFKANTTGTGGPLLGYQDKAFGSRHRVEASRCCTSARTASCAASSARPRSPRSPRRTPSTTAAGTTSCCP